MTQALPNASKFVEMERHMLTNVMMATQIMEMDVRVLALPKQTGHAKRIVVIIIFQHATSLRMYLSKSLGSTNYSFQIRSNST